MNQQSEHLCHLLSPSQGYLSARVIGADSSCRDKRLPASVSTQSRCKCRCLLCLPRVKSLKVAARVLRHSLWQRHLQRHQRLVARSNSNQDSQSSGACGARQSRIKESCRRWHASSCSCSRLLRPSRSPVTASQMSAVSTAIYRFPSFSWESVARVWASLAETDSCSRFPLLSP